MPEGPSLVIMRQECQLFAGRKIRRVEGNSKVIDIQRMSGQYVEAVRSWGKHFLVQFPEFALRVHLMMFGSYRINERKQTPARLSLEFGKDELNLYGCSVRYIEGRLDHVYDWSGDVLSPAWDPAAAHAKLLQRPEMLVCDALLDQAIFAGVGNIIKNEALFRIYLHPLNRIGALPANQLEELISVAREYSFDFLEWKKAFVLKKHWLVHNKVACVRCMIPLRRAYLGKYQRRTFYCENCQMLWDKSGHLSGYASAQVLK